MGHVCLPDDAAIEVNARKRARETDSVISKIYVEAVGQERIRVCDSDAVAYKYKTVVASRSEEE